MILPPQVQMLLNVYRGAYKQNIFLAGGAVRDYVFYGSMDNTRDYDLFLQTCNPMKELKELQILADRSNMSFTVLLEFDDSNLKDDKLVDRYPWITARLSTTGLQIDVILSDMTIQEHLDRFSCNAAKVMLKEDGNFAFNAEFYTWMKTGELEFIKDVDPKYEAKIRERFE